MILRYIGGLILAAVILFATTWHFAQVDKAEQAVYAKWGASNQLRNQIADTEDRANRAEEKRRKAEQQGVIDDANAKVQKSIADAGAARDAAARLRARVNALVAAGSRQTCGNSTAAEGGAPAADPADLLADVLSIADDRSGQLAEYADQARIAGEACQRAYQSLTAE